jgi:small conductance mechanosensitive channel
MIAAGLTCDSQFFFYGLCHYISEHDPTGFGGPVAVHAISSLGIFLVIYIFGRLIRRTADSAMLRGGADPQVRTLMHNVITVTTYTAAVLSAIVVAGVNVGVMLTAAGVTTVAIGLAFQDILRNILAGIWLLLERPFHLGDSIAVVDQAGTVENITLRTTTLKTSDGRLAILPNLTAFSNPVVNASSFRVRQFSVRVKLSDDVDIEAVMREARAALSEVSTLAERPEPSVAPVLEGDTVVLRCNYWIDQTEHNADAVAADITRRVWKVVQGLSSGA